MADALGVASSVLTLVVFSAQSCGVLHDVVKGIKNHNSNLRALRDELQALIGVLESLEKTISEGSKEFDALKLPLVSCSKACLEFKDVIDKCSTRSDGDRRSIRDWAKLKYMGSDLIGFKHMLAGYKSTIAIALGDANL
jgi:hypothetical protein